MTRLCDNVETFVDGELSSEEAEHFRLHLPDCAACQLELSHLMQLDYLGQGYAEQGHVQVRAAERARVGPRRWFPFFIPAAAALAAVLVWVLVRSPSTPALQHDVFLAGRSQRLLEARLSDPRADVHHPPAARMMGAGEALEELPIEDLAVLQKTDPRGLVTALLVRDEPGLAAQALKGLEKLERSPDVDSDRAVARLLTGKPEEALRLLDAALADNPRHPQALWNRGLVLRELGLPLMAALDFSAVAALKEPGWAEEAARRAEELRRPTIEHRDQWKAAFDAGEALLEAAPGSLPEGFSLIPGSRRLFYDAVRAAPSRERVLALRPIARELDARAGGHVLEEYVRQTAGADFSRRAPLARRYADLARRRLSPQERERFLAQLLESREDDLLLGALVLTGATASHSRLYEAKVAASGDPWMRLLAAEERSKAELAAGRWTHATQVLLDALGSCPARGLEYRCTSLLRDLSSRYITLHQIDTARSYAERGWKEARASNEWGLEQGLLWNLAEISRFARDTALARAYLGEFLEHDRGSADTQRRVHQNLAIIAIQELRVEEARREIDAALATGHPLALSGALALADISRLKAAPGDEAHLVQSLEQARATLSPGEQAIARHVLGRFFIERDAERGRSMLRRIIQEAGASGLAEDKGVRRARAYSFTSLLMDAGRRGDFQEALKLFSEEQGEPLPRECLLAATADSERTLLVAVGAGKELVGSYDEARRRPLSERLEGLVPEALLKPLRGCRQVQVLARPPLHGRASLLPSELAWSYLTRTSSARAAPTGPAVHLVVSDVELPPGVGLKRLNPWAPSFGSGEQPLLLSREAATPSEVLRAMRSATEIDLVAHGIVNDSADASYLLLAPEQDGRELGVPQVRAASLQGAPFVVLAACHAAYTTYSLDERFSLPAAFIEAGARGVLAATVQIPDLEAGEFFNAIRVRMRSGTPPAEALREERVQWRHQGRGAAWLDSVLLFE